VHRVTARARERLARAAASPRNPFLPPEPELTLGEVSPAHLAVLNKYPVRAEHLLLVTRDFVHQETLLDAGDLAALAFGLAEIDALGFYNSSRTAGASQLHRHLQLVPLPLAAGATPVPIEPLLEPAPESLRVPRLPFAHAFARVAAGAGGDALLDVYLALLAASGLHVVTNELGACASAPYNLLVTRRWMLVVPRTRADFDGVPVNALGFAGSLFARDEADRAAIAAAGPLRVLQGVAAPLASLPA
jgi:ATP adenylyltransferase